MNEIYIVGQIWGLTKLRINCECNSKTWNFFENLRNFANLLIFKFDKTKFSNLDNFENYQIFIIDIIS